MIRLDSALVPGHIPLVDEKKHLVDFYINAADFGIVMGWFGLGRSDIMWQSENMVFRDCSFQFFRDCGDRVGITFGFARLDRQNMDGMAL